ncbi:hypothetical protein ACQY0O_008386 [Thecaphora frezii]
MSFDKPSTRDLVNIHYSVLARPFLANHRNTFASGAVAGPLASAGEQNAFKSTCSTFVVRVDNIPWTADYQDIKSWIADADDILVSNTVRVQAIHIPIEFKTGKTSNACYIECRDREAAWRLVRRRNNSRLCGRPVSLIMASMEELFGEVFPLHKATDAGFPFASISGGLFTKAQLQSLIALLRDGSAQLKGHVKPVEYMVSIVECCPGTLSPSERDLLFERVYEMILLCLPAKKELRNFPAAVDRLLYAVLSSQVFTVTQRIRIVQKARELLSKEHLGLVCNGTTEQATSADVVCSEALLPGTNTRASEAHSSATGTNSVERHHEQLQVTDVTPESFAASVSRAFLTACKPRRADITAVAPSDRLGPDHTPQALGARSKGTLADMRPKPSALLPPPPHQHAPMGSSRSPSSRFAATSGLLQQRSPNFERLVRAVADALGVEHQTMRSDQPGQP